MPLTIRNSLALEVHHYSQAVLLRIMIYKDNNGSPILDKNRVDNKISIEASLKQYGGLVYCLF